MQFISNKTKVLTLLWNESYHNTYIYHIYKKKYYNTLQLTYLATFKACFRQLFTIKVYMPIVQFAEVPNKSSISYML